MNELSHLTRRHYERNEADASLVSKVTRILDSLPDGSVDASQLAGLDHFIKQACRQKRLGRVFQ